MELEDFEPILDTLSEYAEELGVDLMQLHNGAKGFGVGAAVTILAVARGKIEIDVTDGKDFLFPN